MLSKLFKFIHRKKELSEKDIFGHPDFRLKGKSVYVAQPTARRYVTVLKILDNSIPDKTKPLEADTMEKYAVQLIEKARIEEALIELKLKEMVAQENPDLLELYKAVFDIDNMPLTFEDVANAPFWQILLGLSIFFYRHKKPLQTRDSNLFKAL